MVVMAIRIPELDQNRRHKDLYDALVRDILLVGDRIHPLLVILLLAARVLGMIGPVNFKEGFGGHEHVIKLEADVEDGSQLVASICVGSGVATGIMGPKRPKSLVLLVDKQGEHCFIVTPVLMQEL